MEHSSVTPAKSHSEVCVPSAALAITDGEGSAVPEPGDQVSVTLEGKVTRVEGDNIYFQADMANGQPMPQAAMTEDEQLQAEANALRAELKG